MHILIAPNAFKNSLDATAAAETIHKGLMESKMDITCTCFPVGDGGDGTAKLLFNRLKARIITVAVHDPLGREINASLGLIDKGKTAMIEMADASGLRLLKPGEYDPLHATSLGTGELIRYALDNHVDKIIIGIGGSATVDGAVGVLQSLGIRFLDKNKEILKTIPEDLINLAQIDISNLDKRISNTELIVLCDVENTLLGINGAARIFGPQKGADETGVEKLEAGMQTFRDITFSTTGKDMATIKYGGAAGGIAAGLCVFLNARLVSGIEYFLDLTGFSEALEKAHLVITGEGSIDLQTLQGKGPFGVARRAKEKSIPVIGLAGKLPLHADASLQQYFDVLLPINNDLCDLDKALKNTAANLFRTAQAIGNLLAFSRTNKNG